MMARTGLKANGPWFAIYSIEEYREHDIDVEVAIRLEKAPQRELPPSSQVSMREMPGIFS